jgi:hypothetical protein
MNSRREKETDVDAVFMRRWRVNRVSQAMMASGPVCDAAGEQQQVDFALDDSREWRAMLRID